MKIIAEGYDAHVLDVAYILRDSSEGITTHKIVHCGVKTNVLPPTHSTELDNAMGNVHVEDRNA